MYIYKYCSDITALRIKYMLYRAEYLTIVSLYSKNYGRIISKTLQQKITICMLYIHCGQIKSTKTGPAHFIFVPKIK